MKRLDRKKMMAQVSKDQYTVAKELLKLLKKAGQEETSKQEAIKRKKIIKECETIIDNYNEQ